ncbi:MAG: aminotransferase class V-fold PLP-dependent enzyme [Acidobacteria bacterium]|nr:aminotransferase class V-fold PLP-dependent enzyme [Acidobacteriota bacterium]
MTIYLDNAATSHPKPPKVYETLASCLQVAGANPGRAGHKMARLAQQIIENTRFKLTKLISASSLEQIIFTFNATDALNMAIKGILEPGDHVITSYLEHNSVLRPLQNLAQKQITLTLIKPSAEGLISPKDIEKAIRPETKLIAITGASNVLGTLQPIEEIGDIAHQNNKLFLVDASQVLGVIPIDVEQMHIDLLAGSGHKALMGPPGTGFLYTSLKNPIKNWREGGTGGDSLSPLQPTNLPHQLEAGTHNFLGIAGLETALDFIEEKTIKKIKEQELFLLENLIAKLKEIPEVTLYGTFDLTKRVGVQSLSLKGYSSDEVATILDEHFDIAVRGGLHCAPLLHQALGTVPNGLVRVSLGAFNTLEDIEAFIFAIKEIIS